MPCHSVPSDHVIRNAAEAAGRWLLHSGIQSPSGGVARFCHLTDGGNRPISNEITGYVASAFAFLFRQTDEEQYREAARRTALFLTRQAWRPDLGTFPFENGSPVAPAYFFDCGIIARGLMAVHRLVGAPEMKTIARETAEAMKRDFLTPTAIHPIVELPSRRPVPYEGRWSREPGCLQLKAALIWHELGGEFAPCFELAVEQALAGWRGFLPERNPPLEVMNRLHAFSYFLEALLSIGGRSGIRAVVEEGLARAVELRDTLAPRFARSDVYAQILRVRLWAETACDLRVDAAAAEAECDAVLGFRDMRSDPRAEGGFYFGRLDGEPMPYANPVSTAFCLQAAMLYGLWRNGEPLPDIETLI